MTTVTFVVHPDRAEARSLAARATEWLTARGHRVVAPEELERGAKVAEGAEGRTGVPAAVPGADEPRVPVDLAVSLGGDGTMLRTVALAGAWGIPVLGVNLGRFGYLTEVEPSALETALDRFVAGDYKIEERMTLEVVIERSETRTEGGGDGDTPRTPRWHLVLNEAVVEKTVPGHTIRVALSVAGRLFVTYAADGVLVATPTGSTAYNLSVRGPILSPSLRALVVTPVSPHMLFDRPLVLDPEQWLRLDLAPTRPAVLVLDGRSAAHLEPGDAVECRAGRLTARLVSFGGRDFHSILRARFDLAGR
jgi:NAD+ kinase